MANLLDGLRRAMPPPDALTNARGAIDALPAIIDALGRVPAVLREMPPAPVIAGALSRIFADAIAAQLVARGPSPAFVERCGSAGVDADTAHELHRLLVVDVAAQ